MSVLEASPTNAPEESEPPSGRPPRLAFSAYLPWFGFVAGSLVLAVTYSLAETQPDAVDLRYVSFWVGLALFVAPTVVRLLDPLASGTERLVLLVGLALFTAVPKFLRNQGGPLFFDEFAHWNQSQRLFDNGQLLADNALVRVLDSYPGLHTATASLKHLTGLSTWQLATLIIVAAHVLEIVGLFRLAQRITRNSRAASLAAVIYAFNPAFLFFNSQYAYQTLGISLLIWMLVFLLDAIDAGVGGHDDEPDVPATVAPRLRAGFAGLAAFTGMAAAITHHTVGFIASLFLVGITAVLWWRGRHDEVVRRQLPVAIGVTVIVAGFTLVWLWVGTKGHPDRIGEYLGHYPLDGFQELLHFGQQGNSRPVFVQSGLPLWMRISAFLAPLLAVALGGWGWWTSRRGTRRLHPAYPAFVGLAAVYALSLPWVLTKSGSEAAHRSFPFSWIGVSVLVAMALATIHRRASLVDRRRSRQATAAILVVVLVLAMGNLATDANDYYLFPGPWTAGSDTRAYNAELASLVTWMRDQNPDQLVVSDAFTGASLAAVGDQHAGCRLAAACLLRTAPWTIYDTADFDAALIEKLKADGFGYIVVDRRLSTDLPRTGFWFNRNEPNAFQYTEPIAADKLLRFEGRPWAHRVWASQHLDVYRLDLDRYAQPFDIGQNLESDADRPSAGTTPPDDATPPTSGPIASAPASSITSTTKAPG